ncbi:MAG TPA: hypothetical protein VHQ45_18115 [Gemmatimonadaceae bacterium]|jgi:hypothetical protein|nr:hypothetical protein [Gemmatimonadaceae bacterium]
MAQLTHQQYDALERAITRGQRVAVWRRGTEYLVIPRRLRVDGGRELVEAVNPTTGDAMTLYLDTVDAIEVVG